MLFDVETDFQIKINILYKIKKIDNKNYTKIICTICINFINKMSNTECGIKTESEYDFYKLKKIINPKRLYWNKLVSRKDTLPFIEKNIEMLKKEDWKNLSRNPFAVTILEKHLDKISWNDFVNNPNSIHIVEKNIELCFKNLNYRGRVDLLSHPNFVHILEKYLDKIIDELCPNCLSSLAHHKNPRLIDLLAKYMEKYPEKIPDRLSCYFWSDLCENPFAVNIIEQHLDKLSGFSWQMLAKNQNAVHIIDNNLHKLEEMGWRYLSENPNAIPILEKHIEKINWFNLSSNPSGFQIFEKFPEKIESYLFINCDNLSVTSPIFELDYVAIRKRCSIYKKELMLIALHPYRIEHYLQQGIRPDELDNYI